ncbi:2-amino-4-hydroxy-6-hydroxymethyldihydropteridine diphosphokinase [Telmatobacter sp. DSM 110680]|uniref:2-amino-4-hydroxy-6-hydroxymethyldihydropteridine pyrophosphokinase n=1 Tax=Telmatobacter sp. DSM 110680 TaxID=3036704 RepID=A0AAU7DIM3_9BACT
MQTAYIALGANLASWAGPPEATLAAAVMRLNELGKITARSSLYSTAPVGYTDQPRFLNSVVALETECEPLALLNKLLVIEKEYGRDRSTGIPNGPRTLDLDILLIGDLEISLSELKLPHPRLTERAFVLVPLHEIAPKLPIAGRGKTVSEFFQMLQKSRKGETDAVVQFESDDWRAAANS